MKTSAFILIKCLLYSMGLFLGLVTQAQNSNPSSPDRPSQWIENLEDGNMKHKPITFPLEEGSVVYEYKSLMDSSLSKERIYRAAINWYYKNFPYGKSMIIQSDLREGQILARGEFQFPYSSFMEALKMKVQYLMNLSIRYGKYRIRFYEIEPQDQILEENDYGKTYSHFEPRSLSIMYEQYLQTPHPPNYMQEKMEGIDSYFKKLIQSFIKSMRSWTLPHSKQTF